MSLFCLIMLRTNRDRYVFCLQIVCRNSVDHIGSLTLPYSPRFQIKPKFLIGLFKIWKSNK